MSIDWGLIYLTTLTNIPRMCIVNSMEGMNMKTKKQITVKAWLNGRLVYTRCHKDYLSDEGMDLAARSSKHHFERAGYTVTMAHETSYLYEDAAVIYER